jgi:hypothetical protein
MAARSIVVVLSIVASLCAVPMAAFTMLISCTANGQD